MLKNDFFWMSQGKVATCDRWGGQICKVFTVHIKFSQDLTYQKLLKSVDFWQNYSKHKKVDVFGVHRVYRQEHETQETSENN